MRASTVFVLVAAGALAPTLSTADPAQPQSVSAAALPTGSPSPNAAPPTAATGQAASRARLPAGETVIVNGRVQRDDMLDRIVCRPEPPRTGSRLGGVSECHTVREWDDFRKASQSSLDNIQVRALSGGYGR